MSKRRVPDSDDDEGAIGGRPKKRSKIVVDSDDSDDDSDLNLLSSDSDSEVAKWDENLMGDEKDRAWLETLPELRREEMLLERRERREARERRLEAKRLLAQERKKDAKKKRLKQKKQKKKKAAASLQDDLMAPVFVTTGQPKPEPLPAEDPSEGEEDDGAGLLSDLSDSESEAAQKEDDIDRLLSGDDEPYVDPGDNFESTHLDDLEDSEDDAVGAHRHEQPLPQPAPGEPEQTPLTVRWLRKAQIKRESLEKIHEEPYFDKFVVGLYVRLCVGQNKQENRPVYRICEISGIEHYHRHYKFGKSKTRRALRLKHGRSERVYKMMLVSNQPFSDEEWEYWVRNMSSEGEAVPSEEEINERILNSKRVSKEWVYDDKVNWKLQRQRVDRQDVRNVSNIQMEKIRVRRLLQAAELQKDERRLDKLRGRLHALEEEQNRRKAKTNTINTNLINKRNLAQQHKIYQDLRREEQEEADRRAKAGKSVKSSAFDRTKTRPVMPSFKDVDEKPKEKKSPKAKEKSQGAKKARPRLSFQALSIATDATEIVVQKDPVWHKLTEVCKALETKIDVAPVPCEPGPFLGRVTIPSRYAADCIYPSRDDDPDASIMTLDEYFSLDAG